MVLAQIINWVRDNFCYIYPQGFNASSVSVDESRDYGNQYKDNVQLQKLGTVGPNEQEVWLVTVDNKPAFEDPLYITAQIKANSEAAGTYYTSTSDLIKAVVNDDNLILLVESCLP